MSESRMLPTLAALGVAMAGILAISSCVMQRSARKDREEMTRRVAAVRANLQAQADVIRGGQGPTSGERGYENRQRIAFTLVNNVIMERLDQPLANLYDRKAPGYRIGATGMEPGLLYLDTREVDPFQGGPIRLTGVVLDARRRPQAVLETFPIDFDAPAPRRYAAPEPSAYDRAVEKVRQAERKAMQDSMIGHGYWDCDRPGRPRR